MISHKKLRWVLGAPCRVLLPFGTCIVSTVCCVHCSEGAGSHLPDGVSDTASDPPSVIFWFQHCLSVLHTEFAASRASHNLLLLFAREGCVWTHSTPFITLVPKKTSGKQYKFTGAKGWTSLCTYLANVAKKIQRCAKRDAVYFPTKKTATHFSDFLHGRHLPYRPSPVKLSPPPTPLKLSPLGEKVRGGQYHVRQKGGTISRTVGGWPFWCEEGRAKVVPATPLKLSPPALKLSVGAKYRFFGGGGQFHEGGSVQKKKKNSRRDRRYTS